ncbi:type II toxin-antitoxin system VapC family toxin [Pseudaestuariivita atlantica]|uniref:Twitching motility protein PilT n=1 Tax=Pseudaestuariivita atlantica TaxID=1317121 RepID=A0A0L1JL56_9RHOB|nr:type II toxin-antitoxin system VapC family toxin [Pseudaestuariivita atlantica]KNG92158.1 twitching motility protein PilT [Pseudaestuariivita atlantica]
MTYLLDTHLLLWAAYAPDKLSAPARALIEDPANDLYFSVTSLWEVAIKAALGRADFTVDAGMLRAGLIQNGYIEQVIEGRHVLTLTSLPRHHADPFDRMLVAQALADGRPLVTADRALAAYPGVLPV